MEQTLINKILVLATEIRDQLGSFHSEQTYQNALEIELQQHGIRYVRQPTLPIFYKNKVVGFHRPDLIVEDYLIIELKVAKTKTNTPGHLAQLERYVKCLSQNNTNAYTGLLLTWAQNGEILKDVVRNQDHNDRHITNNSHHTTVLKINLPPFELTSDEWLRNVTS